MTGYVAATTVMSKAARKAQSMSGGRISLRLGGVVGVGSEGIGRVDEPFRRGVRSSSTELRVVSR
jgi:hypothetical protein